jgi:hypothetical protein
VLQRFAFQIFHDDEGLVALLADVVNRADVGMIQRRCGLSFAAEAAQRGRVAGHIFGKELQGHEAA